MGKEGFTPKHHTLKQGRQEGWRTPKPGSMLIVTEGKTERLYFDGLVNYIKTNNPGARLDVKVIDLGRGTKRLVEEAIRIANYFYYENKWVCFDKDDSQDFDEAITLAGKFGFHVAWSNQAFEYWLYLHFNFAETVLHRSDWLKKVGEILRSKGLGDYDKCLEKMFMIFAGESRLKTALHNASLIKKVHQCKDLPPSKQDPCTTVDELIRSLDIYLKEFLP